MNHSPRILIVGSAGQLGVELQRSFKDAGEIVAIDREGIDIAVPDQIRDRVRSMRPDIILNAAAYTAVDQAETNAEIAMAINATAPQVLAEEALRLGALLVHYSTDYVFNGAKQGLWTEEDPPAPLNLYGESKLAGELAIQKIGGRYLIFRTSWVYGPHGRNFLLTMLRLGREKDKLSVVDDQVGAPTTSIELADATRTIVDGALGGRFGAHEDWAGLYHMTCSGSTSWCKFAREIFARASRLIDGKSPEITAIPTSAYPTPAKRPLNSCLSNDKLKATFGIELPPWEIALERVIGALDASR